MSFRIWGVAIAYLADIWLTQVVAIFAHHCVKWIQMDVRPLKLLESSKYVCRGFQQETLAKKSQNTGSTDWIPTS